MDTLIINESLSQDLIIPDDNIVTIPIQIEKNGKQYFPVFDESIGGRNLFSINTAKIRAWISTSHIIASADDSTLYAIPVEPNTYYTFNIDSPYTNLLRTGYITSSTVIGSSVIMSDRNTSVPRTIKTGVNATFFVVQVGATTAEDAKRTIKLEKGTVATDWTPAPEELLELSSITSNFCKVTKDNNNIILSNFSADQGYIEFEVPYGDDWTINHRVNITRDIKFRPLAFDNRLLKFQDRLLHIRETPHIMYSELMDYAYSNNIETPPTNNLRALNYLYKNLESEGLDMFDLLYNFAYIDTPEQFKLLNLWNKRGYDGTAYGGLMWSNEGVQGNGVNGYIDTNFNPSLLVDGQKYQLNDASRGSVVCNLGETNIVDGLTNFTENRMILGLTMRLQGTGANFSDLNFLSTGFICLTRYNNTQITGFVKDDTQTVNNSTVGSHKNESQKILRSTVSSGYSDLGLGCYFIGSSIIYEQTQTFRQIYNKYLSSIGLEPIA